MASAAVERPPEYQRAYDEAGETIQRYEAMCRLVRERTDRLVAIQRERPDRKTEALVRLCQQDNPASQGKKYSPSQAEDVLQLDPSYASYKNALAEAEMKLREAEDSKEVAHLWATRSIAHMKREGGLR